MFPNCIFSHTGAGTDGYSSNTICRFTYNGPDALLETPPVGFMGGSLTTVMIANDILNYMETSTSGDTTINDGDQLVSGDNVMFEAGGSVFWDTNDMMANVDTGWALCAVVP